MQTRSLEKAAPVRSGRARFGRALGLFVLGLAGACASTITPAQSSRGAEIKPTTAPMSEARAPSLPTVHGGPAKGKRDERLEAVALLPGPEQPVGIAVSKSGRLFMSFPRWSDPVASTVVELRDGAMRAFPDPQTNTFDGTKLAESPPNLHLVSVQALAFDERDRLWLLDPGSVNFEPSFLGAPKLWAYDIESGQRLKEIAFPNDVAMKRTYLNDVRFDLKRGDEGTAYITDSGVGGIIVVDLKTGNSWRQLDQHPSVLPTPDLVQNSEGEPFLMRKPNDEVMYPDLRSDGLALSPDGKTLYYTTVASRDVYAIATDLLADRDPEHDSKVRAGVRKIATKASGSDGILCDARGRIYTTDFEDNAIRSVNPANGDVSLVLQDERLIWPDSLALHDGQLYVTSNQLARQPSFHAGKDARKPPYVLFRFPIDENAATKDRNAH